MDPFPNDWRGVCRVVALGVVGAGLPALPDRFFLPVLAAGAASASIYGIVRLINFRDDPQHRKLPFRSKLVYFGFAFAVVATWFSVREIRNELAIRRAFPVVRDLGGRIGSLPFWPIGCEYHVAFHGRDFTDDELQRLAVLNELPDRNFVGIVFSDTNLTTQQVVKVRRLLPRSGISRYVNGQRQDDR